MQAEIDCTKPRTNCANSPGSSSACRSQGRQLQSFAEFFLRHHGAFKKPSADFQSGLAGYVTGSAVGLPVKAAWTLKGSRVQWLLIGEC